MTPLSYRLSTILLTIFLTSCSTHVLFGAKITPPGNPVEQTIRPCVALGTCTMCGTSSCVNCPKLGNVSSVQAIDSSCRSCKDTSPFCSSGKDERQHCVFTAFIPRAQGTNTARELTGWEEFIYQYDVGDFYLTTGHVFSYSRSFRPERIARELFGDTVLRFSGSQVTPRGRCEILADNFGLSPYLRGAVTVEPIIENYIFDNQFFVGLDPLVCGLYFRAHMPLVHTRWNLRLHQTIESEKVCREFPAGSMSTDVVPAQCDILAALGGQTTFGDMREPWQYGRLCRGVQTKTALADIDLILGYMFRQTDSSHMAFYGQLGIPTGNKFTAQTLFEPIVGNAKHWEFGGGFNAHLVFLEHDAQNNLALYLEGNIVHMFSTTQMRSFDFCKHGPLSRYMLLKEVTRTDGQYQYAGNLINGINVATQPVAVSIGAKADISVKLAARTTHFIADLGYNFFGQTRENLTLKDRHDERLFAIKGAEGVYGLEYQTVSDPLPVHFGEFVGNVPLNSSQSRATIRRPSRTDNPQVPSKQNQNDIVVTAFSRQEGDVTGTGVTEARVSAPPKLIGVKDLDLRSGELPAQASHKVFGYLGYNCFEYDWCANPYLGIGGEVEFDARSISERTALNQWSVWLKGGFEF